MKSKEANSESRVTNLPYFPPNIDEVSIVASTPYLGMNEINRTIAELKEIFQELSDCGFNLFHTQFDENYKKVFDDKYQKLQNVLQASNGIKTLRLKQLKLLFGTGRFNSIHAEDITKWLDNFVGITEVVQKEVSPDGTETYKNVKIQDKQLKTRAIELFGGITQDDEPVYCQLTQFSTLYHCNKYLQEILPKYFPYLNNSIYINLPGSGGQKFTMGVVNYEQYINIYQRNFKPSFFSYDCYPIRKAKLGVYLDDAYFYDTLEIFSNIKGITDENGAIRRIPFWAFYLGTGFTNKSLTNFHPSPTEAYLRITAFSALGYGAKGISCWTYHQRPNTSDEIYFGAPIDLEDNKTASWHYVKKINQEILRYNEIFFKTELVECVHYGITSSTRTKSFKEGFYCISKLTMNKLGAMISCLQETPEFCTNPDNPIRYIIIVSHDIDSYQKIHIEFDSEYTIYEMTPKSSHGTVTDRAMTQLEQQDVNRILIPGGYIIFKFI